MTAVNIITLVLAGLGWLVLFAYFVAVFATERAEDRKWP